MTSEQKAPAVLGPVQRGVRPQCALTPWFPIGVLPVRDGMYLCRVVRREPSDCWHALRWHCGTRAWYSADSTGANEEDVIGGSTPNRTVYQWRGLAA